MYSPWKEKELISALLLSSLLFTRPHLLWDGTVVELHYFVEILWKRQSRGLGGKLIIYYFKNCIGCLCVRLVTARFVCGWMSLTIVAPGHKDTVQPTLWFIDPMFSTKESKINHVVGQNPTHNFLRSLWTRDVMRIIQVIFFVKVKAIHSEVFLHFKGKPGTQVFQKRRKTCALLIYNFFSKLCNTFCVSVQRSPN